MSARVIRVNLPKHTRCCPASSQSQPIRCSFFPPVGRLGSQWGKPIIASVRPAIDRRDILAFGQPGFGKASMKAVPPSKSNVRFEQETTWHRIYEWKEAAN
jgi:hypothetical protein